MASPEINWGYTKLPDNHRCVFDNEVTNHTLNEFMKMLRSMRAAQETTSAINLLAAAVNRGDNINYQAEATRLGVKLNRLIKRVRAQQHNQSTFAVSSQLAADKGKGKEIDIKSSDLFVFRTTLPICIGRHLQLTEARTLILKH